MDTVDGRRNKGEGLGAGAERARGAARRRWVVTGVVAAGWLAASGSAVAASKVDVCHVTGNGGYQIISVSTSAGPAHAAHGDWLPSPFYADTDGDGFGNPAAATTACTTPGGYVANGGDCDDTSSDAHPGASETCNTLDDDCDGQVDEGTIGPTWYYDADGDSFGDASDSTAACAAPFGYVADATDCDDTDLAVNPNALETCSAVDDDCDGVVNEPNATDAGTWYADGDADGYGDAANSTRACDVPFGFVADATDCDDATWAVNPGATETCDGLDQDCDGLVDEDAVDALAWFADADGDAFGDPDTTTWACTGPAGTVLDATDCDDTAYNVNPAEPELCNDVDDDCDAVVDEPDALDAATWYADADVDGFGDAALWAIACDQPGGYVADGTDCDDGAAGVNPGATEVCNGLDDDCTGEADDTPLCTDLDGDGYAATGGDCDDGDDGVYPGAPEACDGVDQDCDGLSDYTDEVGVCGAIAGVVDAASVSTGVNAGAEELHTLPDMDGDGGEELAIGGYVFSAPFVWGTGPSAAIASFSHHHDGQDVRVVGDADGDGVDDVAWTADQFSGLLNLYSGTPAPRAAQYTSADATTTISGPTYFLAYMTMDDGGDLTGDGENDLVVTNSNGVYVLPGPVAPGPQTLPAPAIVASGYSHYASGPMDLDGDGADDLVVSLGGCSIYGCGSNGGTTVAVVWGGDASLLTSRSLADIVAAGDGRILFTQSGYVSHITDVENAHDTTGDGIDDLIVMDRTSVRVRILSLEAGRNGPITQTQIVGFPTTNSNNQAGPVAAPIDLDGDARMDLVVTKSETVNVSDGGVLYAFAALPPGSTTDLSVSSPQLFEVSAPGTISQFGWVLEVGDYDGDGLDDIATADGSGNLYVLYPNRGRPACLLGDQACPAADCEALHLAEPGLPSGDYWIDPAGTGNPFEVTCDMETEGGGWTLVMRLAPYYEDPSWTTGAPYGTIDDPGYITRAYAELEGFTDARWSDYHSPSPGVYVYDDLFGDVTGCGWSGSLFDVVSAGPSVCTPTWIGSGPAPHALSLSINASTTWLGCAGLRARIGYYFYTWDGGVSGTWQGQGRYGYKTNNYVLGTNCVFDEGNYAGRGATADAFWLR